jgi:predicted amidophosphoribosyltransferase
MSTNECPTCGAPRTVGLVACHYCKAALPDAGAGIPCPKCEAVNREENATCVLCNTSLSRGCLFCGSPSPLTAAACTRCGEAFAGAEERKRQRDEQAQEQQTMQLVEEGIGVLGAAATGGAGAGLFGALEALARDAVKK